MIDRECPAVAGGIPEKLVMIAEKAKLAGGRIGNGVGVLSGRKQVTAAAEVDALSVAVILDVGLFGSAVAGGTKERESNNVTVAQAILVSRGEIPIDAMANLAPLAEDMDCFGHGERGVALKSDVAVIVEDAFALRQSVRRGEHAEEIENCYEHKTKSAGHPHVQVKGRVRVSPSGSSEISRLCFEADEFVKLVR